MEYEAAASKAPSRLAWWFRNLTIALGVWFVIAVVALVYVTINGRVPQFAGVKFNLAIFVAWTVVFVAAAALTRTWTPAGASVRILAILFFGLLFATSIVGGYFAKHEYASVLQWIFVFVVVLFPGTLYFLFISSRRQAMFTAFWVAIGRLGLLNRRQIRAGDGSLREESEEEYALRKQLYFERFAANAGGLDGAKVKEPDSASSPPQFETAVTLREAIPVFVYTALIAIGWISLMQCALILPGNWANVLTLEQLPFLPIRKTAPNFAFLGAYFFCLQLLVRRFMSHDLAPGAYVSASFRTVLAVVLTWAVTELLEGEGLNQPFKAVASAILPTGCDIAKDDPYRVAIAFVVGAFPLAGWKWITTTLNRFFGGKANIPNLAPAAPLSAIDGLTVWNEARLEDEGIENVPNLASADLVELIGSTRYAPQRLIEWIDQAILRTHMPPAPDRTESPEIEILHKMGIRNASGFLQAMRLGILAGVQGSVDLGGGRQVGIQDWFRILACEIQTNTNIRSILAWRYKAPELAQPEWLAKA